MSKLTAEQWEKIDAELSGFSGFVHMEIDNFKIDLTVQSYARFKQCIVIYIDGKIDFSIAKTDIAKRFWCPRRRYIFPLKLRKRIGKMTKKRRNLLGYDDRINELIITYGPLWKSFRSLKSHLLRNNQDFKLCYLGYKGALHD